MLSTRCQRWLKLMIILMKISRSSIEVKVTIMWHSPHLTNTITTMMVSHTEKCPKLEQIALCQVRLTWKFLKIQKSLLKVIEMACFLKTINGLVTQQLVLRLDVAEWGLNSLKFLSESLQRKKMALHLTNHHLK